MSSRVRRGLQILVVSVAGCLLAGGLAAGVSQQVGGAMEPFELCQVIPGLEEKVTGTATGELRVAAVAANRPVQGCDRAERKGDIARGPRHAV